MTLRKSWRFLLAAGAAAILASGCSVGVSPASFLLPGLVEKAGPSNTSDTPVVSKTSSEKPTPTDPIS